jgi:hypothetical protein
MGLTEIVWDVNWVELVQVTEKWLAFVNKLMNPEP